MIRVVVSTLGLTLAVYAISLPLLTPEDAQAGTAQTLLEQKAEWQDRYRTLLRDAARLQYNAEISRGNYARAQRHNYPRGGARQQFILDGENAKKELVRVKEEIAQIFVDARREAIPTYWLYEVDDEPITIAPPASASEEDEEDRAGRNPLYLPEQDDP